MRPPTMSAEQAQAPLEQPNPNEPTAQAVSQDAAAMPPDEASAVPAADVEAAGSPTAGTAEPAESADTTPAAPPGPGDLSPAACAARLTELFPALFGGEGPPKPVKLRIHADIQQRAPGVFSRKALSIFMHRHTTGNAYLKALLTATHRHDLDGQPAGDVAEEHRAAAREELERRRQVFLARRAADRPARGPAAPGTAGGPEAGPQPQRAPQPPREPRNHRGPADRRPRPDGAQVRREDGSPPPERGAAPRSNRPPHPGGRLPPGSRPGTPNRPAPGSARPPQAARPGGTPVRPAGPARPRPDEAGREPSAAEALPPGPEDAARRERAALLRTYEASSLSKANFCALKRLSEADLDALLAQARQERAARGAAAAPPRA